MRAFRYIVLTVLIAGLSGALGVWFAFNQLEKQWAHAFVSNENATFPSSEPAPPILATPISSSGRNHSVLENDFSFAAQKSTSSVVFIQTLSEYEFRTGGWLDWFFEPHSSKQISSGSGVIFTADGYIVTNNHVIDGADAIKVIHGKQTYDAQLIGRDPSSDLAVIKVVATDLPAIEIDNSSEVKVGEWVLAVGNPFNLTSTVTAGIVSAKGRNINILRDKFPIESFIQTDAAINPGNSGGALVNRAGKLIGINTAILSRTGSYAGYGFAIPSNIANKVFEDIKNYGEVQKTYIGADIIDLDSEIAEKLELKSLAGVLVTNIIKDGAADKANLKKGDVIREINGKIIDSKSSLEEYLANLYPGDQLQLRVARENKLIDKSITLTNREGTTEIIKRKVITSEELGVSFEAVSKIERDLLGIESGIKVVKYKATGFFSKLGIPEGFIITKINNVWIDTPEELSEILEKISGRVIISGIDKRGRSVYYPYYF